MPSPAPLAAASSLAASLGRGTTAVVALLAAASLGITATAAWAAWSVSGSTTGSARAATAMPLVLSVSPVSGLYPGAALDVTVQVQNPNQFPVALSSASLSAASSDSGSCVVDGNLALGTFSGTLPTVAAGTTATLVFSSGAALSTSAPDACQGATFSFTASAAGASTTS